MVVAGASYILGLTFQRKVTWHRILRADAEVGWQINGKPHEGDTIADLVRNLQDPAYCKRKGWPAPLVSPMLKTNEQESTATPASGNTSQVTTSTATNTAKASVPSPVVAAVEDSAATDGEYIDVADGQTQEIEGAPGLICELPSGQTLSAACGVVEFGDYLPDEGLKAPLYVVAARPL